MYVIDIDADGHSWQRDDHQPLPETFVKLYCTFCGVKAYTVGDSKVSLCGDYYSGDIKQCTGVKKQEMVRTKFRRTKFKVKKTVTFQRTK